MAFFGRRNRKQEPEESPEYLAREAEMDRLTAAEPEPTVVSIEDLAKSIAPPMREALSNGDLGAYDALYQALASSEERVMWLNAATWYVDDIGEQGRRELLERCLRHNSAASLMLASNIALSCAFDERGSGTADQVTDAGKLGFASWNERARDLMEQSAKLSNYTDPFAYILGHGATVGGGTESSLEHAKKWQAIDPWNPMGWNNLIRQLDARWSGDTTILPQIALYIAENAPEGHPVLAEAVYALNQHWNTLWTFGELSTTDADKAVWQTDHGVHVVWTAFERFAGKYEGGIRAISLWDMFAYGLSLAGLHEEALSVMRQQQSVCIEQRWSMRYTTPEEGYEFRRRRAIRVSYRRAHPLPEDAHEDVEWGPKGAPVL